MGKLVRYIPMLDKILDIVIRVVEKNGCQLFLCTKVLRASIMYIDGGATACNRCVNYPHVRQSLVANTTRPIRCF